MNKSNKWLEVEMPDGKLWAVPVWVIADNRAEHYKSEFGGSLLRSRAEDTDPLFAEDEYEIKDWAQNNMNWSDVSRFAVEIATLEREEPDYQEGWCNGTKRIISEVDALQEPEVPNA